MTFTFTELGVSGLVRLAPGERADYSLTGTFTGFAWFERQVGGGGAFVLIAGGEEDTGFSGFVINDTPSDQYFRFRAEDTDGETAWTGSALAAFSGAARAVAPGLVEVKTVVFGGEAIALTDDADAGQYGSLKVVDMPPGNILVLGAVLNAHLLLEEAAWTDTAEGDVGVGTTAVDDGDALATTEQDVIPTTAIAALVAQEGPMTGQSAAAAALAVAGSADADLYLNIRIDDEVAHDTGVGRVTGSLELTYVRLGDF